MAQNGCVADDDDDDADLELHADGKIVLIW
jgi:hypothetical protein